MTNFELLISDKKRLAKIIEDPEMFIIDEVEPGWCHGACPYKDLAEHENNDFECPVSTSNIIEWWFEQEVTN